MRYLLIVIVMLITACDKQLTPEEIAHAKNECLSLGLHPVWDKWEHGGISKIWCAP